MSVKAKVELKGALRCLYYFEPFRAVTSNSGYMKVMWACGHCMVNKFNIARLE